jgi:hypothetical protein
MPEAQKIIPFPPETPQNAFTDGRCSTIREMQDEHAVGRKKMRKKFSFIMQIEFANIKWGVSRKLAKDWRGKVSAKGKN